MCASDPAPTGTTRKDKVTQMASKVVGSSQTPAPDLAGLTAVLTGLASAVQKIDARMTVLETAANTPDNAPFIPVPAVAAPVPAAARPAPVPVPAPVSVSKRQFPVLWEYAQNGGKMFDGGKSGTEMRVRPGFDAYRIAITDAANRAIGIAYMVPVTFSKGSYGYFLAVANVETAMGTIHGSMSSVVNGSKPRG